MLGRFLLCGLAVEQDGDSDGDGNSDRDANGKEHPCSFTIVIVQDIVMVTAIDTVIINIR